MNKHVAMCFPHTKNDVIFVCKKSFRVTHTAAAFPHKNRSGSKTHVKSTQTSTSTQLHTASESTFAATAPLLPTASSPPVASTSSLPHPLSHSSRLGVLFVCRSVCLFRNLTQSGCEEPCVRTLVSEARRYFGMCACARALAHAK